jgi:hypothetical protein
MIHESGPPFNHTHTAPLLSCRRVLVFRCDALRANVLTLPLPPSLLPLPLSPLTPLLPSLPPSLPPFVCLCVVVACVCLSHNKYAYYLTFERSCRASVKVCVRARLPALPPSSPSPLSLPRLPPSLPFSRHLPLSIRLS